MAAAADEEEAAAALADEKPANGSKEYWELRVAEAELDESLLSPPPKLPGKSGVGRGARGARRAR